MASFGLGPFLELLYADTLIAVDWNGRPQPQLVEGWSSEDEGRTLRLRVRNNVKFHDGRILNTAIVRDVLRENVKTDLNVLRVDASGSDVTVTFARPDYFFLPDLNQFSVLAPGAPQVGTGPFEFVEQSDEPVLKAFRDYYGGMPSIDRVEFQKYPTQRAAWAAMMRGRADFLHEVSRDSVEFVEKETGVRVYSSLRPFYIALVFNLHHPQLRKREVRQAISEAVDRDALIRIGMRGRGIAASGPIWPYHWAYAAPAKTYIYNPEAARVRLASAGLSDLSRDRAGLMPSRLRLRCLYYAEDTRFERIAMVLQKQLSEIGIDAEMEPATAREFMTRVHAGDFDVFLNEMTSGRTFGWIYRFWHSPAEGRTALFQSGYSAADGAIDALQSAQTDDETRAAVSELQRVLYDDPPAVFLAWPQVTRAVDAHFHVNQAGTADILSTIWQWQRDAPPLVARR